MNSIYDCIIIGAGPAGALCAWQLAKQNLKVLLIDSARQTKRKICGEYLCPKGVELLHELGLGDFFELKFEKLYGMKIFTSQGTQVNSYFPSAGQFSYGLSLNRAVFDEHILSLSCKAGALYQSGESFIDFDLQDDICLVHTNANTYKTRILIGADGRKSKVAQQLGFREETKNHRLAIHAYLKPRQTFERRGEMHILRDAAYFGVDPINKNEINISLVCDGESVRHHGGMHRTWNHYIQQSAQLLEEFGTLDETTPLFAVSPIQHKVSGIHYKNIALIGDAAGFVDPITGEGIFNALCTANILSEEIFKEHSRSLNDYKPALARYAALHKKTLAHKTKLNRVFQWIIRRPRIVEGLARFLNRSQKRSDAFVGVVGNIYTPQEGLMEMFKRKAS